MITALLLAAAAALCYRRQIEAFLMANATKMPTLEGHHYLALACLVAAAVVFSANRQPADGEPVPTPAVVADGLSLDGLFTGPTASEDCAALAGLCSELATYVEEDGMKDKPRLTTGWAVADLRTIARDVRMAGISIGDRQPAVREAVGKYLEESVGKAGGPLSPKDRAKWVTAFREIARAAEALVK